MLEAEVRDFEIFCPIKKQYERIPWGFFWKGLAWAGNANNSYTIRAVCILPCPLCGDSHSINMPDNTSILRGWRLGG